MVHALSLTRLLSMSVLMVLMVALLPAPASAQNRFQPVVKVGETVITRYQVDQRTLFLSLLRAPGDVRELATEQLINEALQLQAGRDVGIVPTPESIASGQAEFAARAELTTEEFLTALGANGVEPETFRDFIAAGVVWRQYLRDQFGDDIRASISPLQIDRTLAQTGTEGGVRVLLSEIVLPTNTPQTLVASQARAETLAGIDSLAEFSEAARRFSIAATRAAGGERPWLPTDALPANIASVVAGLDEDEISRPVLIEDVGLAIYYLRDREVVAAGTPETLAVDYALFITGGDAAEPARVAARVDTCDDLYGVAKGLPAERLIRETRDLGALPGDVRAAITSLDIHETAVLQRGGQPALLMLCSRSAAIESTVDQDIIGNRLLNARLGSVAATFLDSLRAQTTIVFLTE